MKLRKTFRDVLDPSAGLRRAEGEPLQWATLVDDLEEPLGAYVQANFAATLTPEQLTPFAAAIVGFVGPYAMAERQAAIDGLRAQFEAAVEAHRQGRADFERALRGVLRQIVDPKPCRIFEGSYCLAHHFEAPCPVGMAHTWLATQPAD